MPIEVMNNRVFNWFSHLSNEYWNSLPDTVSDKIYETCMKNCAFYVLEKPSSLQVKTTSKEIEEWLINNTSNYVLIRPFGQGTDLDKQRYLKLFFEDQNDLVLFKLTWG